MIEGRPNYIIVAGQRIILDYVTAFDDLNQRGEYSSHPHKITLLKDDPEWKKTLFHELIHFAIGFAGYDHLLLDTEESLVSALENILYGIVDIKI